MPCGFLRFRLFLGRRDRLPMPAGKKMLPGPSSPKSKTAGPDRRAALCGKNMWVNGAGEGASPRRENARQNTGRLPAVCLGRRGPLRPLHKGIQKSGSVSGCRSAVVWLWSGPVAQVMSCFWYRTVAIRQETKNQIREKTFTTPNAARVCSFTGKNRFVRSTSATMMPVDAI